MRDGGIQSGVVWALVSVVIAIVLGAFLGNIPTGGLLLCGSVTFVILLGTGFLVSQHSQRREAYLRRLCKPELVASLGPAPRVRVVSAVILLVPAMLFLAGAIACFDQGSTDSAIIGGIPLLISLVFQAGAWMRLRDYAHWRAAWRESLEMGEAKGRWVTISRAAPNSGHNEWHGML